MAEEQKATQQAAEAAVAESTDFESLLTKEFRPKSDRAKEAMRVFPDSNLRQTLIDLPDYVVNRIT